MPRITIQDLLHLPTRRTLDPCVSVADRAVRLMFDHHRAGIGHLLDMLTTDQEKQLYARLSVEVVLESSDPAFMQDQLLRISVDGQPCALVQDLAHDDSDHLPEAEIYIHDHAAWLRLHAQLLALIHPSPPALKADASCDAANRLLTMSDCVDVDLVRGRLVPLRANPLLRMTLPRGTLILIGLPNGKAGVYTGAQKSSDTFTSDVVTLTSDIMTALQGVVQTMEQPDTLGDRRSLVLTTTKIPVPSGIGSMSLQRHNHVYTFNTMPALAPAHGVQLTGPEAPAQFLDAMLVHIPAVLATWKTHCCGVSI